MNSNYRFYVLILLAAAGVAGIWYITRESDEPSASPTAATSVPPIKSETTDTRVSETASQDENEADQTVAAPTDPGKPERKAELTGSLARTGGKPGDAETGEGSLVVKVKDESGNPIADADVRILRVNWKNAEPRPEKTLERSASTDAAGEATFATLPVDVSYGVVAQLGDLFAVRSAHISEQQKTRDVELTLAPSSPVAGHVVNSQGSPVPGAAVFASSLEGNEGYLRKVETEITRELTDAQGRFRFANVPQGHWRFMVQAKGYASYITDWVTAGDENVKIELSGGGSIAGRVVDGAGEPMPNIKVSNTTDYYRDSAVATTDSGGAFTFESLRATHYTLDVDSETLIAHYPRPEYDLSEGATITDAVLQVMTGGSVGGRVYDATTQQGIAKANVRVSSESLGSDGSDRQTYKSPVTDGDGNYTATGLPAGQYMVMVEKAEGYPSDDWEKRKLVAVSIAQRVANIDFPINKGISASGVVVDESGAPVGDATIQAVTGRGGRGAQATSDKDGRFTVVGLEMSADSYFKAQKSGLACPTFGPIDIPAEGRDDLRIVMTKAASVSGTVVDKSGAPVPKARVVTMPVEQNRFGMPIADAGNAGEFKVNGLAKGEYRFQAHRELNSIPSDPDAQLVTLSEGETITGLRLTIMEEKGLTIRGRVTDEKGNPVKNANISAYGNDSHGYTNANEDGTYTISGLKAISHTMSVESTGYSTQQREDVDAGAMGIDFILQGTGSVEGQVVDASSGKPIPDFEIQFIRITPNQPPGPSEFGGNGTQIQDPEGRFHLDNVEAGAASIYVRAHGYAPQMQSVEGVQPNDTLTGVMFRMEAGGSVAGRVTNNHGEPMAGAQIYDGPLPQDYERGKTPGAISGADGTYTLDGLATGTVSVSAKLQGYAPTISQVVTSPGQSTPLDIVLGAGAGIIARVREGNAPAANAFISVNPQTGGNSASGNTKDDGTIEFKGLAAGQYNLYSSLNRNNSPGAANRAQNRQITLEEGQAVEIEFVFLSGNATLEGKIILEGQAPAQAWANLEIDVSADGETHESAHVQVDATGTFVMDGMPSGHGRLNIGAQLPGNQNISRMVNIDLAPNRTTQITIDLRGGGTIAGAVTGMRPAEVGSAALLRGVVEIPATIDMSFYESIARSGVIVSGAQLDAAGTFTIQGVEPGEYTVLVAAFDGQRLTQAEMLSRMRIAHAAVTVEENGTVNVQLALP
jgi:uncharacterized GH25 family protein